jgi:diguanylate cyclase (GGDEF)-like protein
MALIDGLTGVANRQSFSISFAQALAGAKRKAEPMSVLMIDIDHFKSVNDHFGHIAGDKVLRDMALLIKNRIRGWDTLCRWGGEEFVVLLQGTDLDGACTVAEQLRSAIQAEPFGEPDKPLKITISAGVAQCRDGDTEPDITDRADRALYRAKDGSRNRIERESIF